MVFAVCYHRSISAECKCIGCQLFLAVLLLLSGMGQVVVLQDECLLDRASRLWHVAIFLCNMSICATLT